MKSPLRWAGAIALALMPSLALAQVPVGKTIQAPAGYLPGVVSYCDDGTGHAIICPAGSGGGGSGSSGTSSIISGVSYVATAAGTGYSIADTIDHVVVSDPTTGNVSQNFWIDSTTSAKLASAPSLANLVLLTSTAQRQDAILAALAFLSVRQPDTYATGSIAAATANAAYTITPANGQSTAGFVVTGLTGTGAVLTIEASNDGSNWATVSGVLAGTGLTASTLTADGQFRVNASGRRGLRLRVSTAGTGSITASSSLSVAPFDPPAPARDSNGDLRTPTYTVSTFYFALAAATSTEILAPNALRVSFDIQCNGASAVGLSRIHAALTSATPSAGGVDLVIPATANTYFSPPAASGLGVTAYAAAATICWGTSYARQ